jgi:hypothetical protein
VIEITGTIKGQKLKQILTMERGEENIHYEIIFSFENKQNKLEYLVSTFTFNHNGPPDFVHTPTLKYDEERWSTPAQEQIIGDRCFHSPAVILQQGRLFAAIVPDLNVINDSRVMSPDARRNIKIPRNRFSVPLDETKYTMPTGLDLNVRSGLTEQPIFFYGYIDNIIQHHIRYLHPNS